MTARDEFLRTPPHSFEAEQSLLGALLLDNQAFDRVADLVTGEDFYRDDHRRIWRHIAKLIEQNREADVVTVSESLDSSEDKGKYKGAAYLGELAQNTPSALNIRRYAELVRSRSVQRRLAQVATGIAEEALSAGGVEVSQLLDSAERQIFQIAEEGARRGEGLIEAKPILARFLERLDHLYHTDNKNGVTGVPTGYAALDQELAGLQPGDLIILAARPSMGKTALALNIAEHVSVDNGLPACIFSMEMSDTQLMGRMVSSISKVDGQKLRTGRVNDGEWSDISDAIAKLHEVPLFIDQSGALTATEIRARARRLKRQYSKLGVVVIDYLQLMSINTKDDHRAAALGEVTSSLKAMAKELDVPVILLSQLNRGVEQRPDKTPTLADLRDSGAIEQDADVVLFLYRDEYYHPGGDANKGVAEVIIGKQRNGPTCTKLLTWLGQYTRFENYAPDGFGSGYHRGGARSAAPTTRGGLYDAKSAAAGDKAA